MWPKWGQIPFSRQLPATSLLLFDILWKIFLQQDIRSSRMTHLNTSISICVYEQLKMHCYRTNTDLGNCSQFARTCLWHGNASWIVKRCTQCKDNIAMPFIDLMEDNSLTCESVKCGSSLVLASIMSPLLTLLHYLLDVTQQNIRVTL